MKKLTYVMTTAILIQIYFVSISLHALELPKLPEEGTAICFYVATNGNDANSGTQEQPFATWTRAANAVKEARTKNPEQAVIVSFQPGEYRPESKVVLEGLRGTAKCPVVFRSVPNAKGKVVFNGGRKISGWTKLAQSEFYRGADESYKKRIRSEALEHIYVASLDLPGINDFGDVTVYGKQPELFCDHNPQLLARWPNEGFVHAKKACGTTPLVSHGVKGFAEGIFEYADHQPLNWNNEPDAVLRGYWFWDWAESFARIEKIDTTAKRIHLLKPYHSYGYRDGLRYYGLNLLAELDAPGEYYIDRIKKLAFWIPPQGTDPNKAMVSLTCFNAPHMVEFKNCEHVILAGLAFTEGWDSAIHVVHGKNVLLADLSIERFGRDAIHISGGENCAVYNCFMQTLGCGGVTLSGGNRRELIPANHSLENSTVVNFARIKRTYAPAISVSGCGFRIAHCRFSEAGSSAISIGANDAVIEYNKLDNLIRESDDQGGIDCWYNPSLRGNVVRYNWWENIVGGTRCGAAAIRLDDMISGFNIYGNIFVHCGAVHFGAVQIHGGKDNIVHDNVFIDCHAAVSFSSWGKRYLNEIKGNGANGKMVMKRIYEDVDIRSEKWQKKYPALAHIEENPDSNIIENNLIVNGKELFLRPVQATQATNNQKISMDKPDPKQIVSPEFLQKNKIAPIPVEKIGPLDKPFLAN